MEILDLFLEQVRINSDKVLLEDSLRNQRLTIRETDVLSSKVYRYLLEHQIGTEDVVAIRMRKGIHVPVAILGVIKAGAAFVVVGERSSEENARFFIQDSHAKLTITEDVLEDIQKLEPQPGHKQVRPTDLACIIYSSGSSGYFKGSMHEYGQYDRFLKYVRFLKEFSGYTYLSDCRCSIVQGFYDIAGVIYVLCALVGKYIDIIPYDMLKDVDALKKELIDKKIEQATLSPAHLRNGAWLKDTYVKHVLVTFENFGDVKLDNIKMVNRYGLTEFFVPATQLVLDRPYDVTPIGRPFPFVEMYLSDENGHKVEDGTIGEICLKSEYFRGYVNRPEETRKALVDGWLRTGDMAVLEDGQYVIMGRKMDLLKTVEGYIVPCRISVAVKKVTGLSWCYVKSFTHDPSPIVCVYYTDDIDVDIKLLREKLSGMLPEYMLPTHVVKLDSVERFTSGKVNRFAFKCPVQS